MLISYLKKPQEYRSFLVGVGWILLIFSFEFYGNAQTFDSTSDGSDGALSLTTPGTIIFDPVALGLDADGDGVYQFTTINIASGVTVEMRTDKMGTKPVIWLASGNITISGVLDLNGEPGHLFNEAHIPSVAGAGGYGGGVGGFPNTFGTAGTGPGAGPISSTNIKRSGGGAGHAINAKAGFLADVGGLAYGNVFLIPLFGGSGGAGGNGHSGGFAGGGGAGGGAIMIATSGTLFLNGSIRCNGGGGRNGGAGSTNPENLAGGGGSGGSIRILATSIVGSGSLQALRALGSIGGFFGRSSPGQIRIEVINKALSISINPALSRTATTPSPVLVLPPDTQNFPAVRLVSVGGVPVPANSQATFSPADLNIDANTPVTVNIAAENVPTGTVVNLVMWSELQGRFNISPTPLAGTLASSTATAEVTIPSGFSHFSVEASFTP